MAKGKHIAIKAWAVIVLLLSIMISLQGCRGPAMYLPTAANVPLLDTQRRVSATVMAGCSMPCIQGAYGFKNGLAFIGSFNMQAGTLLSGANVNGDICHELGIGYYVNTGTPLRLEFFGGAGLGTRKLFFSNSEDEGQPYPFTTQYNISYNYSRYFIQENLGYADEGNEAALSIKINRQYYDHYIFIEDESDPSNNWTGHFVNYRHGFATTFEPSFTIKNNRHLINLFFQFGAVIPKAKYYYDANYHEYSYAFFNLGLSTKFAKPGHFPHPQKRIKRAPGVDKL